MNGSNLLLDSNIIIYYLQGNRIAYNLIENNNIFISVITEMELLSYKNLTVKEEKIITDLLSIFTIIPLKDSIKDKAIQLRKSYNIKLPDSIIVSSAIYLDCSFVSADRQLLDIEDASVVRFEL
jgi:predicted nucleic acid-binding protein